MMRSMFRWMVFVTVAAAALPAAAQQQNVPNALQGFTRNQDKPVKIEAASLEVRERDKAAVFSGNVVVQQGDTTMRSRMLVVHYDADAKGDKGAAKPAGRKGAGESAAPRQIRRLEASGGVVVTTRDQTATGDSGVFETAKNTITMSGNVVLSQGQNILRGERLVVDLDSGVSRVESGRGSGGRVQGLFVPNSEGKPGGKSDAKPGGKPDGKPGAKPDAKPDPKPAASKPLSLRGN